MEFNSVFKGLMCPAIMCLVVKWEETPWTQYVTVKHVTFPPPKKKNISFLLQNLEHYLYAVVVIVLVKLLILWGLLKIKYVFLYAAVCLTKR